MNRVKKLVGGILAITLCVSVSARPNYLRAGNPAM